MEQLSLFQNARWTVTQLTVFIRQLLETDENLRNVWVQGEISNFIRASSGHQYFTLKDSGASLGCVMWKGDAARNRIPLRDGMLVEAHGRISVYEPRGQYQLVVDVIRSAGEGALYVEYLRLKALLEAEGLFDAARKRPIPNLPRRIGIVTSPTGAALRDMLNTLLRRLPLAEVILSPATVQGESAPVEIVSALQQLFVLGVDVILVARGGGSIEDLWAFNDERVVRTVAAAPVPVISGVGHETDFTLTDFAADLRAPTPTAAAELASPYTLADLNQSTCGLADRLEAALTNRIAEARSTLADFQARMRYFSPERRIQTDRQRVDDLARRLGSATLHDLELQATRLKGIERRLDALSPLAVLQRGYALVTRANDGKLIHNVGQVAGGESLNVRVADGTFGVKVTSSGSGA